MLRNLASSLILTERDAEYDDNAPKVKGRVVTTLQKAKEVRPLVEKCVTIARHSLQAQAAAEEFETNADRGTESWRAWRKSDEWKQWNAAIAPAVAARRLALRLLGDKDAVRILFDDIAPRMADRDGGYTRVIRLAAPRLGDAGTRAILEFVGRNDRVKSVSQRPAFDDASDEEESLEDDTAEATDTAVTDAAEETTDDSATVDAEDQQSEEALSADAEAEGPSDEPEKESGAKGDA
jgi:large subunit ribosomal protein L17